MTEMTWVIGAIGVAVTGALGFLGWIGTRKTSDRERIVALEERNDDLQGQLDTERRRGVRKDEFIAKQSRHIALNLGPPAPDAPDNIFT
ncbi:hypothetical protein E3O55_08535 [Cryobacterium sp. MDB1-18-2]|uniref:hypothetical protein n=1 Tax=unclassified Cryobacterium TaxID=2649013 RepID=UPI00106BBEC6|nr:MULTISPECIES: hypothetical protein [unclassified Cryobacterium]TFC30120.1 hypothetical protein E3O55_08535 [Cryobacterium sp. MDB1-18-2]TFC41400.1 hypothetical protein E3O50_09975 [Cryobacterium sp. MDB1-18-1]